MAAWVGWSGIGLCSWPRVSAAGYANGRGQLVVDQARLGFPARGRRGRPGMAPNDARGAGGGGGGHQRADDGELLVRASAVGGL